MITVEIQNSWPFDLIRIYRHRHDFKKHYFDYVVSKIFCECKRSDIGDDLAVVFFDNHFSNTDDLDYKLLHRMLRGFFRSVQFASDNVLDWARDPEYWSMIFPMHESQNIKLDFVNRTIAEMPALNAQPKKMFGLHFLRPDTHRLGLLVSLDRAGLLDHVDVRIGVRSWELGSPEYMRRCNIDFVCHDFDISPKELFDLIDRMPMGDRVNFRDNATYIGLDHVKKDIEKNQFNSKFAVELVCASSCHDGVYTWCEKIYRPVLLGQPWLYIGNADWYKLTKRQGLRTFSDYWDESWDAIREDCLPQKINLITQTCQDIVNRYDPATLCNLVKSTVAYNRALALSPQHLSVYGPNLEPSFWL